MSTLARMTPALILMVFSACGMNTYREYEKNLKSFWHQTEDQMDNRSTLRGYFQSVSPEEYKKFRTKLLTSIASLGPVAHDEKNSTNLECGMCKEEIDTHEPFSLLECRHCFHAICEHISYTELPCYINDQRIPMCPTCYKPYDMNTFVRTQLLSLQAWLDSIRPFTPDRNGSNNAEKLIKKASQRWPYIVGALGVGIVVYGAWKYRSKNDTSLLPE